MTHQLMSMPGALRQACESALDRDERIEWAGQPAPMRALLASTPLLFFAIPWSAIAFTVSGIALASALGIAEVNGAKGLAAWGLFAFSLPFSLLGLLMLSAPAFIFHDAKRTAYLITNRRILKIVDGRARAAEGLAAEAIRGARVHLFKDGRGTVTALGPLKADEDAPPTDLVMIGVEDPETAARAVWRLAGRDPTTADLAPRGRRGFAAARG